MLPHQTGFAQSQTKAPVMAGRKSSQKLSPTSNAERVASAHLKQQARAISRHLRRATKNWRKSEESIHELRVSTRRMLAAMSLFSSLFSKRKGEWFERNLKKLRRSAGEARDLDVLKASLRKVGNKSLREFLYKEIERKRKNAQKPLEESVKKLRKGKRLEDKLTPVVKKLARRSKTRKADRDLAQVVKGPMRRAVRRLLEQISSSLKEIDDLHRLRIAGKRFRYALEWFTEAVPLASAKLIRQSMEQLQEKLGAVNDAWNLVRILESIQRETKDEAIHESLRALLAVLLRKSETRVKAFHKWWTPSRKKSLQTLLEKWREEIR